MELAYQRMQITELTHRLDYARQQVDARDQLLADSGLVLLGSESSSANEDASNTSARTNQVVHPLDELAPHRPPFLQGQSRGSAQPLTSSHTSTRKTVSDHHNGPGLVNGDLETSASVGSNSDPLNRHEHKTPIRIPGMALVTLSMAERVHAIPGSDFESRLVRLLDDRDEAQAKIEALEARLEEEKQKNDMIQRYDSRSRINGRNSEDLQKDIQTSRSQAQEYKFKLQQSLQRITGLESDLPSICSFTSRNPVSPYRQHHLSLPHFGLSFEFY
ncbi:unnamed protein product [Protopolystoma xenopodis]|uniref:Uncharacterized protein n=1 Tax=Protopolystoma xenopodis TaxID=117903 RepID=A0A3S5CBM8_9PLAT|nr:unnamed protein product [Protopolystoma xenopodis]